MAGRHHPKIMFLPTGFRLSFVPRSCGHETVVEREIIEHFGNGNWLWWMTLRLSTLRHPIEQTNSFYGIDSIGFS
jgi:hypothetical protein